MLSSAQERQEFFSGYRVRPHASQHAACSCSAADLLDATHNHAKVGAFHDNGDAPRIERLRNGQSNLFCQALLNL
jgi:hypothetical protein